MFNFFKNLFKKNPPVKVNAQKAIATCRMKDGLDRIITRVGYEEEYFDGYFEDVVLVTGTKIMENYLGKVISLLQDDKGLYFPTVNIVEIRVSTEDYFIDSVS